MAAAPARSYCPGPGRLRASTGAGSVERGASGSTPPCVEEGSRGVYAPGPGLGVLVAEYCVCAGDGAVPKTGPCAASNAAAPAPVSYEPGPGVASARTNISSVRRAAKGPRDGLGRRAAAAPGGCVSYWPGPGVVLAAVASGCSSRFALAMTT